MSIPKFSHIHLAVISAMLACVGSASAQNTSIASDHGPVSQTVTLNSIQKQELNFVVRLAGSISGRVFDETEQTDASRAVGPRGIRGVKVTLRSRDAGFENFKIEQFTDANGTYDFQYLRPGKYKIEIDPVTLPADYRSCDGADYKQ